MRLRPDDHISPEAYARGLRALVADAAWASVAGSLYGGVILVGFALALDATPLVIGLLAAIPFMAQAVQLPAIALVEKVQQRRKITVVSVTAARLLILLFASLPLLPATDARLVLLVAGQLLITVLGSVSGCSLNSWLHQLLPREGLGAFFAKRLFWATGLACAGTLAAGFFVDHFPFAEPVHAYAVAFVLAGCAGLMSSFCLTRVPEPPMQPAGPPVSMLVKIAQPFRDRGFRRLLVFLGAWNFASNLAAPFLTVYLIRQLGYTLSTVTTLWVTSQLANAFTLYIWGRLSDRFSNKSVLAVALPVYFACTLGLVFTAVPEKHALTLPLLFVFHIAMGAASGGIALAVGNIGLKLAPQGQGTPYLAAIGLVASVTGGAAPIVGGWCAEWFAARELSVLFRWVAPGRLHEVTVLEFAHWSFVFALSAVLGLYVMHALSRVREGEEISERVVVQQFALEAVRTVNQLSSIGGLLGGLFTFGRFVERRLYGRRSLTDPVNRN